MPRWCQDVQQRWACIVVPALIRRRGNRHILRRDFVSLSPQQRAACKRVDEAFKEGERVVDLSFWAGAPALMVARTVSLHYLLQKIFMDEGISR